MTKKNINCKIVLKNDIQKKKGEKFMRKYSKILFMILIMTTLIFAFSVKVSAANSYDDYKEVEEETPTSTPTPTPTSTPTPTPTQAPQNKSTTATTPHPQAGVFETAIYMSVGLVIIAVLVYAYKKIKRYNFKI